MPRVNISLATKEFDELVAISQQQLRSAKDQFVWWAIIGKRLDKILNRPDSKQLDAFFSKLSEIKEELK